MKGTNLIITALGLSMALLANQATRANPREGKMLIGSPKRVQDYEFLNRINIECVLWSQELGLSRLKAAIEEHIHSYDTNPYYFAGDQKVINTIVRFLNDPLHEIDRAGIAMLIQEALTTDNEDVYKITQAIAHRLSINIITPLTIC